MEPIKRRQHDQNVGLIVSNERSVSLRVWKGYAISARHLGHLYYHYRPTDALDPIRNINLIDEIMLAYDPDANFGFAKPQGYDADTYHGLVSLKTVQVGDYFRDDRGTTLFVANIEPLKPSLLVKCNETVTVSRPTATRGYGGDSQPTLLMDNWPAGITDGTKGERNVAKLPESVRGPWVTIHIPRLPSVDILYGDIIIDSFGRRYVVSQNLITADPTWNITASQEIA